MTMNVVVLFILTILLTNSTYKRYMVKRILTDFKSQSEYDSLLDYGIDKADYTPFKVMKLLHLDKYVNCGTYYILVRKVYLLEIIFSIMGYLLVVILNLCPYGELMQIKL